MAKLNAYIHNAIAQLFDEITEHPALATIIFILFISLITTTIIFTYFLRKQHKGEQHHD